MWHQGGLTLQEVLKVDSDIFFHFSEGAKQFLFLSFICIFISRCQLEDVDVVVDLLLVVLADAFGNPHNVPDLLLLELHKRVEDSVVELLHE